MLGAAGSHRVRFRIEHLWKINLRMGRNGFALGSKTLWKTAGAAKRIRYKQATRTHKSSFF